MGVWDIIVAVKIGALAPVAANAHVAEQGFVLLLPTGAWSAAGVAVVVLTVLALAFLPARGVERAFKPRRFVALDADGLKQAAEAFAPRWLLWNNIRTWLATFTTVIPLIVLLRT